MLEVGLMLFLLLADLIELVFVRMQIIPQGLSYHLWGIALH